MKFRMFDGTGRKVSEIGLGTWQLGGADWGDVPEGTALGILNAAAGEGITFIDTADVYGLGRSERVIGKFLAGRSDREKFFVATKLGRMPEPGWPHNFTADVMRQHTEASLQRLGMSALDLTQLHCIPHDVIQRGEVFDTLRRLKQEGLIKAFGASVESMDEAMTCIKQEGLASLQIIFNIFRQKPIEELFSEAKARQVALIVRLPLASGLLAGKFTKLQQFGAKDHRNFNRDGAAFNVGETFAGIPFERGVELAESIKHLTPVGMTMAQFAIRWCLDFDAVTTVIPGASRVEQVQQNAIPADLSPVSREIHGKLAEFYRSHVAQHIRGSY